MKSDQEFFQLYRKYLQLKPYDFPENQDMGFPYVTSDREYSDISAHLPLLHFLAYQSLDIVEIGTRDCHSTLAFLSAGKDVYSIDLNTSERIEWLKKTELPKGARWTFIQGDSLTYHHQIPLNFDTLFIDGLHTYNQVKAELDFYSYRVNRYIVLHDTAPYSHGIRSRDIPSENGIGEPIRLFLEKNKMWEQTYSCEFNHGLTVLQRTHNA